MSYNQYNSIILNYCYNVTREMKLLNNIKKS